MRRAAALALTLRLALSACATVPPPFPSASLKPSAHPLAKADDQIYVLQPGDEIEIAFARTPELNVRQVIRPDGGVSLVDPPAPQPHEVRAADLTVHELRDQLYAVYASALKEPDIAVVVRAYGSNQVYVTGEVARPTAIPLAGPMTALQAVLAADGFKPTSRPDQVLVIRPLGNGRASWQVVNLGKALGRADLHDDVRLAARDIVYVPRSHIANVGEFVDLYFRRLLPIQPGFQIPIN